MAAAPGSQTSVTVNLKPMKAGSEALDLPSQDVNVTVLEMKSKYAEKTGVEVSKIKLLYNKRPASDLKTLKELLPEPAPKNVELSVMILSAPGNASPATASTPQVSSPAIEVPDPASIAGKMDVDSAPPAPLSEQAEALAGAAAKTVGSTVGVLQSEQFWADLKDFLVQRLKDEGEGERLLALFKGASQK